MRVGLVWRVLLCEAFHVDKTLTATREQSTSVVRIFMRSLAHDRQLTGMIEMARYLLPLVGLTLAATGCVVTSGRLDPTDELAYERVRPGISILLGDSMELIRGKRIGLLTNQTGIDEKSRSDIDLLRGDKAKKANVNLTVLFSPEHGIR